MQISDTESVLTIGQVARMVGVSTHTLRLYEREGLLNPRKSAKRHRLYASVDLNLIRLVRRLLEAELNFAGIRKLLATIPCHVYKPCCIPRLGHCTIQDQPDRPCWSVEDSWCRLTHQVCQTCHVYRMAADIDRARDMWSQIHSGSIQRSAVSPPQADQPRSAEEIRVDHATGPLGG